MSTIIPSNSDFLWDVLKQVFQKLIGKEILVDGEVYILHEYLGAGGQAYVFTAYRNGDTDVNYVVKILNEGSSGVAFDRGLCEVEVGNMNHLNLVKALGIGSSRDGLLIGILFEHIRGYSLRQLLEKEGKQPLSKVLDWGKQLSDVLAFIHGAGFIHRDVKPSNIMISEIDQTIKLTDFGLCYNLNENRSITYTGGVPGTLEYMSPERQLGKISPQSDIYSLGMVLYELAYDKRIRYPEEIIIKDVTGFTDVISCCLQRKQHDRYNSAALMSEDLQLLIANKPPKYARKQLNRKRCRFWGKFIASVALLTIFIAVITFYWNGKKNEPLPETKTESKFIFTPPYNNNELPFRLLKDEDYPSVTNDFDIILKLLEMRHFDSTRQDNQETKKIQEKDQQNEQE